MYNIEIREKIKNAGLFGYEVAAACGMAETSFSRLIARAELPSERKAEVINAIDKLVAERGKN